MDELKLAALLQRMTAKVKEMRSDEAAELAKGNATTASLIRQKRRGLAIGLAMVVDASADVVAASVPE